MHVHSLDHLDLSAPPGKRLVVLGDPVSHSLSPAMHNAALAEMAETEAEWAGWRYEAVHVPADSLARALKALHEAGVQGINLTIPHKIHALDLVEEVDEAVRPMGAVNTLTRTPTGYRGTNTDGYGIRKAVEEAFGTGLAGRDVWIFGAGGAARGIVVACLQGGCRRLTVVNRSEPRLLELKELVHSGNPPHAERLRFFLNADAPYDQDPAALLLNATSLGLKADDRCPIDESRLQTGSCVYDTTYGVRNQLAEACARHELAYADGLSMLVWQGARSLEIWTGHEVPVEVMRQAADLELKERHK